MSKCLNALYLLCISKEVIVPWGGINIIAIAKFQMDNIKQITVKTLGRIGVTLTPWLYVCAGVVE
jgi:hypothetical protein